MPTTITTTMRAARRSLPGALALALCACASAPHAATTPAAPPPAASAAPAVAATPAAPPPAPAAPPLATATKVRSLGGITEYRLSNGLQVLLFPDPSQPTVTVNVTYFVGSRLEGYGETGMAHLLEHMTFKGTPRHRNILKLVDARGGSGNGSTWTDRTNYFETLSATQDNLDWALDLEADRMENCPIAASDLETEFSVVRNEFEKDENDPVRILDSRMMATAYLWHNYGKDTIGSKSDIERVPADRLRVFYKKYYQPDDAMLVVSGRFDAGHALAEVEKTFGAIPRPDRTLEPTYTVEPVQDGERTVVMRRTGKVDVVGVLYHTVAGSSPDYAAVRAALDVLTREPSGLLYKKLVETKLASSVWGYEYQFKEPSAALILAKVADPRDVDKVAAIMTATVEGLGKGPIDPAAVERWRSGELKDFDLAFADSEQAAIGLSEFAALGDWRTMFAWLGQVRATTPADVARVASAYFKRSNRTLGEFLATDHPDRAPETETPDVEKLVAHIDGVAPAAGEAFAPSIDNLEARTMRKHLKGGIDAALLPKKTRAGKVVLDLHLRWGDARSLRGKEVVASMAAAMLSRGTTKHDLQAVRDLEDKLEASIWIGGGVDGLTVHVDGFRDKLPGILDLVGEELTSPSFPAKELEIIRRERLARLEEQVVDPSARARRALARLTHPWPKDDPRYVMTFEEEIAAVKKVSVRDVRAFDRDFIGAGHGQVAVVGDFDPAALSAQLERLFGAWQSRKPYARLDDKVFPVAGGTTTIDTPDKKMAQLRVGAEVAMRDDDPDYPAWLMLGKVLGGDTGARIWMRLREHEGLSYGAFAWTSADPFDQVGWIGGSAIVAPQNLARARASMLDEFAKMAGGAVTDDELARARKAWSLELHTRLARDGYVAAELADGMYEGRTLEWQRQLEAKVLAVTPADVARVARKYLHPGALVVVQAGDMKQAEAAGASGK